jgi:hypothetical protein
MKILGGKAMTRWEYSSFATGVNGPKRYSTWTGPDGREKDMTGPVEVILTTLGRDGWEVVSNQFVNSGVLGSSDNYLLKRPLDDDSTRLI